MPVDIYVNPVSGIDDDSSMRGQFISPYRSLERAAQRASSEELAAGEPPGTFIGTIHAATGIYQPPSERFPIIVPPGFDLVGAGSDATEIRFTGETRTRMIGGSTVTYWGGDAIYVGRHLRGLTLQASPVPFYTCSGIYGIRSQNDQSIIEDVEVTLDTAMAPAPTPEDHGLYHTGFRIQLWVRAIEVTLLDCLFEHASRWGVLLRDCGGMVVRTQFDGADFTASGTSNLTVDACTARHNTRLSGATGVTVQNCTIGDPSDLVNPFVSINGPNSRLGPFNLISAHSLSVGGGTQAFQNAIDVTYKFIAKGAARVVENQISALRGAHRLLEVPFERTGTGVPVFEGNVFTSGDPAGPQISPILFNPIEIRSSADFGGGGSSAGGNDFGDLFLSAGSPTSRILIDVTEDPSAEIYFDGNYWDDPDAVVRETFPHLPGAMFRFEVVPPATEISVENRLRSP